MDSIEALLRVFLLFVYAQILAIVFLVADNLF